MSLFSQIDKNKQNNLNAIRLFLAIAVILSHASILSYGKEGEFKGELLSTFNSGQMTIGQASVNLFFFLSGILITASFLKKNNLNEFLINRFLRIYPAYIAAMVFTAAVIWIVCTEFRNEVGRGFSWVFVFLHDCMFLGARSVSWKGVFENNPFPGFANGSLWTIPWEFQCYLMIAFIGVFGLFRYRRLSLAVVSFCFLAYTVSHFTGWTLVGSKTEWRFATYYLLGMSAWLWRDKLPYSHFLAGASIIGLFASGYFAPWFEVIFPLCGTYLFLWIGFASPVKLMSWTDRTDLSYGVYLYAFPIQQILAMHEVFRVPWLQFIIATPLAMGCAWLSWTFIEKRFLSYKGWKPHDYDPATQSNS